MTAVNIFLGKQLKEIVEDAVGEFEEDYQRLAKGLYDQVVQNSPVLTGYYKTNHSIIIKSANGQFKKGGGGGKGTLQPPQKDSEEPGAYINNLGGRVSTEKAKIDDLELGDIFTVLTEVPYADEVEQKHLVYGRAKAEFGFSND